MKLLDGINYIAIPLKDFEPVNGMIFPVIIDGRIPMMAQYINPYWESIPNGQKLGTSLTHVLVPKEWYVRKWLSKHHLELQIIITTDEAVYNIYNNIAVVYMGFGTADEKIYEVNNLFFKLKLQKQ